MLTSKGHRQVSAIGQISDPPRNRFFGNMNMNMIKDIKWTCMLHAQVHLHVREHVHVHKHGHEYLHSHLWGHVHTRTWTWPCTKYVKMYMFMYIYMLFLWTLDLLSYFFPLCRPSEDSLWTSIIPGSNPPKMTISHRLGRCRIRTRDIKTAGKQDQQPFWTVNGTVLTLDKMVMVHF